MVRRACSLVCGTVATGLIPDSVPPVLLAASPDVLALSPSPFDGAVFSRGKKKRFEGDFFLCSSFSWIHGLRNELGISESGVLVGKDGKHNSLAGGRRPFLRNPPPKCRKTFWAMCWGGYGVSQTWK